MVWEIGHREVEKIREMGKGSLIQSGYKFPGKYRRREIEDIVRITPGCDHPNCSVKKLKSRINLLTQLKQMLNQMHSGALICSWKEKHIKLSHTMNTRFSSCLSVLLVYHQTEDILYC